MKHAGTHFAQRLCAAIAALTFSAAFAFTCSAIRDRLPFPDVPDAREKIEHLAANADAYDTLLIGSSRIAYQVIPSIFDAETAARGMPTHSFNAALAGMNPPEDAYLLDTILRHPPTTLRWVILELASLGTGVDRTRGTVRSIYWRDWERTLLVIRRILSPRLDSQKKSGWKFTREKIASEWPRLLELGSAWAQRATNVGRGTIFTDRLFPEKLRLPTSPMDKAVCKAGWTSANRPAAMQGRDLEEYQRGLDERKIKPRVVNYSDATSQEALAMTVRKLDRFGARVVFVVPPTLSARTFLPLPGKVGNAVVLDFSDMEKYAELYQVENRIDTNHLNDAGSEMFTRLIAARLVEASRPSP